MPPHCGFEGLSTLGLKQQRIESRCGMGRDQAAPQGSLGVYSAISHRPIRTKQRPNQQQNAAPLRLRRLVDTGPEAAENRISTIPRAHAARHREVPVLCLERHWLRMQHPSMKPKPEKFWHPYPPNRGTKTTRGKACISRIEREGQCSSKATPR